MATRSNNAPLIAIVGETGSGKSALALSLAQQFGGEIIAADSRTIYKGMDIGTAKPSPFDQKMVKHHLIDVVKPSTKYSASDFKYQANAAIDEVHVHGALPFIV